MKKVLILGSMNNLPTCYALDFSNMGCDVIQVVGFSKKYQLHDPSNFLSSKQLEKFKLINLPFIHNFLFPIFGRLYFYFLLALLPKKWTPDVVIFNDTYLTISKFFKGSKKFFLPHGGDIETWCGFNGANEITLSDSMKKAGIFQLMPKWIRKGYILKLQNMFKEGLESMDSIIYFPLSFTSVTRNIGSYCSNNNIQYIERYDISLEPLKNIPKLRDRGKVKGDKFRVLVPVRFAYKTFPEGNDDFDKGSDIIIYGIERFLSEIEDLDKVEVLFYEKGVDLIDAKSLVDSMPKLRSIVEWKSVVPFNEFLSDLEMADFCFDGVGKHWPGAIAAYGLILGVDVGANFDKVIHILPSGLSNLHNVSSIDSVCFSLKEAFSSESKALISEADQEELKKVYSTMETAKNIIGLI